MASGRISAAEHAISLQALRRLATASYKRTGRFLTAAMRRDGYGADIVQSTQETLMGKYFIAWLLGVPAFVLVIVYLFFH